MAIAFVPAIDEYSITNEIPRHTYSDSVEAMIKSFYAVLPDIVSTIPESGFTICMMKFWMSSTKSIIIPIHLYYSYNGFYKEVILESEIGKAIKIILNEFGSTNSPDYQISQITNFMFDIIGRYNAMGMDNPTDVTDHECLDRRNIVTICVCEKGYMVEYWNNNEVINRTWNVDGTWIYSFCTYECQKAIVDY